MTSPMYMSSHSGSESASGGPRTRGHATMACGGSGYLSWCTPRGGGKHVRENKCENRAIFAPTCCIYAFAMAARTKGKLAVGVGQFVGRRGTAVSQKGAFFFVGTGILCFWNFTTYSDHPKSMKIVVSGQNC